MSAPCVSSADDRTKDNAIAKGTANAEPKIVLMG